MKSTNSAHGRGISRRVFFQTNTRITRKPKMLLCWLSVQKRYSHRRGQSSQAGFQISGGAYASRAEGFHFPGDYAS